jgi:hypothetical protein
MPDTHDYTAAVETVNLMYAQFAGLARAAVAALKDGKVSTSEGLQLGLRAMSTAAAVQAVIEGADAATLQDVLYVLEHGRITV